MSEEDSANNDSVSKSKEKTSYDNDFDKAFFLISFVPLQLKADDNIIGQTKHLRLLIFVGQLSFNFLKKLILLSEKSSNFIRIC